MTRRTSAWSSARAMRALAAAVLEIPVAVAYFRIRIPRSPTILTLNSAPDVGAFITLEYRQFTPTSDDCRTFEGAMRSVDGPRKAGA